MVMIEATKMETIQARIDTLESAILFMLEAWDMKQPQAGIARLQEVIKHRGDDASNESVTMAPYDVADVCAKKNR